MGDRNGEALALKNMGSVYVVRGLYEEALDSFRPQELNSSVTAARSRTINP